MKTYYKRHSPHNKNKNDKNINDLTNKNKND